MQTENRTHTVNGLRFLTGCDRCNDVGCYWCLASHTQKCLDETGGTSEPFHAPPIMVGNCQSVPCAYEEVEEIPGLRDDGRDDNYAFDSPDPDEFL